MCRGIDGNGVGVGAGVSLRELSDRVARRDDGQGPVLAGDVDPLQSRVISQDIRGGSDADRAKHSVVGEVIGDHLAVAFAGHEGAPRRRYQLHTVSALTAGQVKPADNSIGLRINSG